MGRGFESWLRVMVAGLLLLSWCGCGSSGHKSSSELAAGSAGAGTGQVGAEICGNGLDDDGDGEPDCSDPDCLAIVADPTQPAAFADTVSWLYTQGATAGCGPLQAGVADGALNPRRVAVVRGRVSDATGQPLAGAQISVVGAPELGHTHSRADGLFDLAVNGGGKVTLEIGGTGYLSVQRRAGVPANSFTWVAPSALKARSTVVTTVDLTSGTALQVVKAEASDDSSGRRAPVLFFPSGMSAVAKNADGSESPLDSLSVRLTEFSVGDSGPDSMPGDLPSSSAYTYAFELSADEAEAMGASGVAFDHQLPVYLENFLGFPAGTRVPVGYYDRHASSWQAENDGLVIGIVSETAGAADLDLDGDGKADTGSALQQAGISTDERQRLAELYEPGQSLWRVGINHFSAYDFNWAFGFPSDVASPPVLDLPGPLTDKPGCASGSILRVDNRTLGESIAVAGTGYGLYYQSDRAPGGQQRTLDIEVAGDSVPASLKHIDTAISVAGQRAEGQIAPGPHARFQYAWDGRDVYGRPLQGAQSYTLSIGYSYDGVYTQSARADQATFAQPGSVQLVGSKTRKEVSTVREVQGTLGGWDARGQGLGGFTLDVHHAYDPRGRTLYYGDGRQRSAETVPPIVTNVFPGTTLTPREPLALPDGSLLFVSGNVIYHFADGRITPFAGGGTPASGVGDGGPALGAALVSPRALRLGPDGSVYFWSARSVRRVDPAGQISSVVTGVTNQDPLVGEGVLATQTDVLNAAGLAISSEGVVYLSETALSHVYRVGRDGHLETVVGGGVDPGKLVLPARTASVYEPAALAFGPDGILYIAGQSNKAWRIDPDGLLSSLVGNGIDGASSTGDGGPAVDATINSPRDIAVDPDGNLFLAELGSARIRHIGTDGFIDTLAKIADPLSLSIGPDGTIYVGADVSGSGPGGVFKITPALPGASSKDLLIAAEDGSEVYRFDAQGRHLSTVNALTGVELRHFDYDADGRLADIVEDAARTTRIERGSDGTPSAIVSPYGVRTQLALNPDGYLKQVSDAAGQSTAFEYATGGLLTALVDQRGGRHDFTYDSTGHLLSDRDPSGAVQTLTPSSDGKTVTVTNTTPLGLATRHARSVGTDGIHQDVTTPGGATSLSLRDLTGNLKATSADGTIIATTYGADPRFGSIAPISAQTQITLPSGLGSVVTESRTVELSNLSDPLSLTRLQTEVDVNARAYTSEYDATTRTLVQHSPVGRTTTVVFDANGRVSDATAPGLLPTHYDYDADGRVVAISSGTGNDVRRLGFEHTADGWVGSVTDALGESTAYSLDPIGRTTATLYPDGSSTTFGYDAASNLTALTPPSKTPHAFDYDPRNLPSTYTPPALASGSTPTTYAYDADQRLTSLNLPGTSPLTYSYDTAGRLSQVQYDAGNINLAYDDAERLIEADSPDGVTLSYTYDGALPTGTTWSGAIQGSVAPTYDKNFFVTSLAVNGTALAYQYDTDGLVTRAGALQITHDPTSALLTASTVGGISSVYAHSPRGELTTQTSTRGSTALYAATHTYDALGRIASTLETLAGVTTTNEYAYDVVGQLVQVTTDGTVSAAYSYDADGNRLSTTTAATSANATYDAQERLLTYGDDAYSYTDRGTLKSRANAGAITSYTYDALGNLTTVALPDGRNVTYLTDAQGRRVGKSIDGTLQNGWLYQDSLHPIAELDVNGAVASRFVYGTKANVPDLMIRGSVTYALLTDVRGSVRLVVDTAAGTVAQRIDYGPFGEVTADSAPGFQPFGFAGGLYDVDTGLVRFGARDYDARVGRWVSKDPIGFGGGQSNLYGYVGNDPVNAVDPSGRFIVTAIVGGLIGGALDAGIQYASKGCVDWHEAGVATVTGTLVGLGAGAVGALAGELGATVKQIGKAPTLYNLGRQLAAEEAQSAFTATGDLSREAIQGARQIIAEGELGNPAIPRGLAKYSTETFRSPSGPFQVHYYANPTTGELFYGLDYKVVFNNGIKPY